MKLFHLKESSSFKVERHPSYQIWKSDKFVLLGSLRNDLKGNSGNAMRFGIFGTKDATISDEDYIGFIDLDVDVQKVQGILRMEVPTKDYEIISNELFSSLLNMGDGGLRVYNVGQQMFDVLSKMGAKFYTDDSLSKETNKLSRGLVGYLPKRNFQEARDLIKSAAGAALGISIALSPTVIKTLFPDDSHKDPEIAALISKSADFQDEVNAELDSVYDVKGALEQQEKERLSNIRKKEVLMLAKTIWGEARSDGEYGMYAVANVIKNRAESPLNKKRGYRLYGKGIQGVISKNKAFSAWNDGDPNREKMLTLDPAGSSLSGRDLEAWKSALKIASDVVDGKKPDITKGATHYHTTSILPRWASAGDKTGVIGSHIFYKNVDG
jgi:spore germination cell wall hydrolase CwlJ-like protein